MSQYPSPPTRQLKSNRVVPPNYQAHQGPPDFPLDPPQPTQPAHPSPGQWHTPGGAPPAGYGAQGGYGGQAGYGPSSPSGYPPSASPGIGQYGHVAPPGHHSQAGYGGSQSVQPGGGFGVKPMGGGYAQPSVGYAPVQPSPSPPSSGYAPYGAAASPSAPGSGMGDWFNQSGLAAAVGAAAMNAATGGDPSKMVSSAFGEMVDKRQSWLQAKLHTFKEYFNVTHSYVVWKLLFVLFPFLPQSNSAVTRSVSRTVPQQGDDEPPTGQGQGSGLRLLPGRRPDLYIPVMGYITYILIYGLSRGKEFHPDDLYNVASLGGVLGVLEILLVKGVSYILAIPTLTLTDIVAVCMYKFANLSFSVLLFIFLSGSSRTVWIALWLWAALTAGLTVHKGLLASSSYNASAVHYMGTGSANTEKLVAVGSALAQLLWCWVLMPAFVSNPVVLTGSVQAEQMRRPIDPALESTGFSG